MNRIILRLRLTNFHSMYFIDIGRTSVLHNCSRTYKFMSCIQPIDGFDISFREKFHERMIRRYE